MVTAVLFNSFLLEYNWASLVAQTIKNLPAVHKTRVPSLGREDLLAKGMAAHCSILAGEISWTEEPGGYSPCGRKEFERRTLT